MAINYPTSLDAWTNPDGTGTLAADNVPLTHHAHHSNHYDAIEALEARVGITGSADATSLTKRIAVLETATTAEAVPPALNGFTAWTWDPARLSTNQVTPVLGTLQVVALWAPTALSITNAYCIYAGAATTPTSCRIAVYSGAGALLATSGHVAPAFGLKAYAVSASVSAGLFYLGLWQAAAAAADYVVGPEVNGYMNANLVAATSRFATANTGLTTTAPATIGTKTLAAKPIWAAVS